MSFPFHLPVLCDGISECSQLTDSDSDICSEKIIFDNPELLTAAKQKAVRNGSAVVLSPTGGVTHSRLEEFGLDEEFVTYNTFITNQTAEAVGKQIPVGGVSVPSRLFVPPYTRNIFEDAYFTYLEKMTVLKDAGTDFILMKNQNNLWDMRAGVLAAKSINIPVFVTMRVDEDGKNPNGTDYIAALVTLQAIGADAFGIFCEDTDASCRLLEKAFPHAEIPLIAVFDTEKADKEQLTAVSESGASVFIDLSCWQDEEKRSIFQNAPLLFNPDTEKDSYAAAIDCEAFFLPDNLELSEPIDCTYDMSDDIIDLDDENINAVYLMLNSTDDAAMLSENATMSRLPFLVHANDTITLEAALRYYQGRLIVDTRCDIDESELASLSQKYGAILY